jgi:hypothetical protein
MRSPRLFTTVLLASWVILMSGPAVAQTLTVDDPAGDGLKGSRLDITSVRVSNRDHAIVVKVSVVRLTRGDLAVRLKIRKDGPDLLAGVTSVHRTSGDTNKWFTEAGVQQCEGLRVSWSNAADRVRIRVPSQCLEKGNYGAVKAKVITEIGSDADLAPKSPDGSWRWTEWVSRG